jgi:hypothetical protein
MCRDNDNGSKLCSEYVYTGVFIDRVFELTVLIILILAVVFAYMQTSKLDINPHPIRYGLIFHLILI